MWVGWVRALGSRWGSLHPQGPQGDSVGHWVSQPPCGATTSNREDHRPLSTGSSSPLPGLSLWWLH